MTQHWSFTASAAIIAVAIAAWLFSACLSFLQWRQRGGGARILAMETLRLVIVALICAALFKPELVQEIPHTQAPQVVVLTDASGSMQTRDVPEDAKTVLTRAEWLRASAKAERWKPLASKGKVTTEEFATTPTESNESADAGTDINSALEKVLARTDNLKAVLLLSDGDWNAGQSPVVAAAKASARGIPIYAMGIGSEKPLPDLAVQRSTTPAYGLLGDQITIPFKVQGVTLSVMRNSHS